MSPDVLFALIGLLSEYINAHEGYAPLHLDFEDAQYGLAEVIDAALHLDPDSIPVSMLERMAEAYNHVGYSAGAVVCAVYWLTEVEHYSDTIPANPPGRPGLMLSIGAACVADPESEAVGGYDHVRDVWGSE